MSTSRWKQQVEVTSKSLELCSITELVWIPIQTIPKIVGSRLFSVRFEPTFVFCLENGTDRKQHKSDEMHTGKHRWSSRHRHAVSLALMEACMDGHVQVAKLLLDHGADVNMPPDSYESPLTLSACGGHIELASLLIERGANLEEVNDEGYTPLMEGQWRDHESIDSSRVQHSSSESRRTRWSG